MLLRLLIVLVGALGSAVLAERLYRARLRDWVLNWGATPDEVGRRLPGDELLEDADIVATRAIGIEAPPSAVWPWLVQMGPGRGGAYTYDWIENLFGLNMHSADRVHPEWQDLKVGDVLRSSEDKPGMRVEVFEPERALTSRSEAGDWVWTFALEPQNGSTRLVSRNRIAMEGAAAGQRLGMLVMEPGSLVMERKMLLGIKQRAERSPRVAAGMADATASTARNRVELTAQVAASPDEVFTYLTERFDDLWPGRMDRISEGTDPREPLGLGFVRRMHTAAGKLDEEIVAHERPRLIEYKVINGDEAAIHNHLGHIELSEADGGTRIDYTVSFDYKPPFLGPVGATVMRATWALRGKRRLRRAFPG